MPFPRNILFPGRPKSGWGQVFLQWSVGMMVSTPLIAILQGSRVLYEYRTKHRDAPFPNMPARGVAVAIDDDDNKKSKSYYQKQMTFNQQEPPLRILLIGDSLAAGVGMSKSGSPVLPESIARALSKECGGRTVYWDCVGTPGISAAQIVRDIDHLDDDLSMRQPSSRLERLIKEWQAKRTKFLERKDIRRRLSEQQSDEQDEEFRRPIPNALKEWWEQITRSKQQRPAASEIRETTSRVFGNWWSRVKFKVQEDLSEIKEDLADIKEIVQTPAEDAVDSVNPDAEVASLERAQNKDEGELIRRGDIFRRDSVNPKAIAARYDIAVVLTGLNDIKEAFLPHMNDEYTKNSDGENNKGAGVLANNLEGVVQALEGKMERTEHGRVTRATDKTGNSTGEGSSPQNPKQPLIVVPELPVAPLQLFRLRPLRWFLIPLFQAMEKNKKFLSSRFPDYVVFIPQPDLQWWSDVEAGFGPIRDNLREERILFKQTEIAQRVKEQIQKLMRDHYNPQEEEEVRKDREQTKTETSVVGDRYRDEYHHSDHNADHSAKTLELERTGRSPYVSADAMHPNDAGYELWGRHIAAAIVEHWNR